MKRILGVLLAASLGVLGASLSPNSVVCEKDSQTFWPHVYHPDRLKIITPCFTVSGTVDHISQPRDGDTHIRLTLDPAFEHILNDGNRLYQHGALVVEIVCAYPVTLRLPRRRARHFIIRLACRKLAITSSSLGRLSRIAGTTRGARFIPFTSGERRR